MSGRGSYNPTNYSRIRTVKYRGLVSDGSSNSLNSLLQVLFMTKEFREAVQRHTSENASSPHIDRHLQLLFSELKIHSCSAFSIRMALGIQYVQRIGVEYFEKMLSLTSPEASQVFCVELMKKVKCIECGFEGNIEFKFWSFLLEVVNTYSVMEGLEQFFKPSTSPCERCRKSNAFNNTEIKTPPEILTLMLKRVEHGKVDGSRCPVDVPFTLNTPQNQTYELFAVVDHHLTGYSASIKCPDDDIWRTFQDSNVTELNPKDFQETNRSFRSSSANLLFYRKQKTADGLNQDVRGAGSPEDLQVEATQDKRMDEDKKKGFGDTAEGPGKRFKDLSKSESVGTRQRPKKEESPGEGSVGQQVRGDMDCESSQSVTSSANKETRRGSRRQQNSTGLGSAEPIKYHGLKNQGQTCYLNSVLQVLFMTPEFREAVHKKTQDSSSPNCVDHHLKSLFEKMSHTTCSPDKITKALGIKNVCQQQDASVYLEKILSLTSPQVSKIFRGELTSRNVCCACQTENDTHSSFWSLPLELVDSNNESYSVEKGVEKFFQPLEFSGENQIYCDSCSAKADASVSRMFKTHPDVLMLLLKRFELNNTWMRFDKRDCSVAIPCVLHLPQDQTYELYAVVNHAGRLGCGHYTATIKVQDEDRWYNFSDSTVTMHHDRQVQDHSILRSRNAYLLFYKRNNNFAVNPAGNEDHREEVSTERRQSEAAAHERARHEDECHQSARCLKGNDTNTTRF